MKTSHDDRLRAGPRPRRSRSTRRPAHERGAAAVEFALVVPLLVTSLFAVVEGGTRYSEQDRVSHYAAVAARGIAIDPTKTAGSFIDGLKAADGDTRTYSVTVSPTPACPAGGSGTGGTQVTVTVQATVASPSGMFGTYTVRGVGVARCEN